VRRVQRERELTEERNRMMEKLQKMAVTDGLTLLFQTRGTLQPARTRGGPFGPLQASPALLLIDIDRFKDFNDSFGHLEGTRCWCVSARS